MARGDADRRRQAEAHSRRAGRREKVTRHEGCGRAGREGCCALEGPRAARSEECCREGGHRAEAEGSRQVDRCGQARGHEEDGNGNPLMVWAVLVAAGRGERLGEGRPKAFVRLGELPLLAEPLRRLDQSSWIDAVVVVAPPEWEEPAILLAEEVGASKVVACVTGGESRSASVRAGVAEVPDDVTVILVHDAARPLLPDEVIGRLIGALGEGYDGAVPVLPMNDTVKRVRDGVVDETLVRDDLVTVQTPQAFAAPALRAALAAGAEGSDCASLVEANGGRIRTVEGDERLLKVTTRADLERVASWL